MNCKGSPEPLSLPTHQGRRASECTCHLYPIPNLKSGGHSGGIITRECVSTLGGFPRSSMPRRLAIPLGATTHADSFSGGVARSESVCRKVIERSGAGRPAGTANPERFSPRGNRCKMACWLTCRICTRPPDSEFRRAFRRPKPQEHLHGPKSGRLRVWLCPRSARATVQIPAPVVCPFRDPTLPTVRRGNDPPRVLPGAGLPVCLFAPPGSRPCLSDRRTERTRTSSPGR
jgi:hypothetical protein